MLPKRILVATDGSEAAQAAEGFASSLAGAVGDCEIVLVTVLRHHDIPTVRGIVEEPLLPEEVQAADQMLAEAEARVRAGLSNDTVTVRRAVLEAHSPAVGIIEASHENGECSLIVMGNRGHGGFASLLLGSVSTQVLHGAHCPVVVVKA
jgi:nucleotide-binding universal stress UspA family protein